MKLRICKPITLECWLLILHLQLHILNRIISSWGLCAHHITNVISYFEEEIPDWESESTCKTTVQRAEKMAGLPLFFPNSRSFFFLEIIHINGSLQCLSEKVHNELTINVLLGMKLTTTFLKSGEQTSLLFQFDVILSVILIIPSVNHNPVVDPCSYFWKLDHSNFFFAE